MAKKKTKKQRKLTPKQKLFVEYYLQSWNATLAAEQANYKGNKITLASVGYENLRKPHIKKYISRRLAETVMTSDEVLGRLGNMARSFDMTKYISLRERFDVVTRTVNEKEKHYREFAGYVVSFDLEKLQEDGHSHLVKKIKQNAQGGIEIEWHDQKDVLIHLDKQNRQFGALDLDGKKAIIAVIGFDPDKV